MNPRYKLVLLMLIITSTIFPRQNSEKENLEKGKAFLTITDYREREVVLTKEPSRIISLAPNITEIIYALGSEDKLIARTDYCDYPKDALSKPTIGNLFQPSIEKIVEMNPDLIIASTHFQKELLLKLTELKITVIIIDELDSMEGLYKNIEDVARIVDKSDIGSVLVTTMKNQVESIVTKVKDLNKPRVYYVIDYGEYGDYTAGGDTFISEMIELAGGINVAKDSIGWSYSIEKVVEKNPDLLVCSVYYNKKDGLLEATGYKDLPAVKSGKIFEIDNNLIDRQGPRVPQGIEELAKLFHPEIFGN